MKKTAASKKLEGTCLSNYKTFSLALQALIVLAKQSCMCPSSDIAIHLEAEATVLRRILSALSREQLIMTKEGREGGYRLARPADKITLADVYLALHIHDARCSSMLDATGENSFGMQMKAAISDVLMDIDQSLMQVLRSNTIADMANKINK